MEKFFGAIAKELKNKTKFIASQFTKSILWCEKKIHGCKNTHCCICIESVLFLRVIDKAYSYLIFLFYDPLLIL